MVDDQAVSFKNEIRFEHLVISCFKLMHPIRKAWVLLAWALPVEGKPHHIFAGFRQSLNMVRTRIGTLHCAKGLGDIEIWRPPKTKKFPSPIAPFIRDQHLTCQYGRTLGRSAAKCRGTPREVEYQTQSPCTDRSRKHIPYDIQHWRKTHQFPAASRALKAAR